jgi:putative transcriptional regulator
MKRNLFAELTEGFDALKAEREGKRTLRTHAVERKPAPAVNAKELVRVRAKLNLSRAAGAGTDPEVSPHFMLPRMR